MIKLKNILTEILDDVPHILFHATFKALLPLIKKEGIVAGGGKYRNFVDVEKGVYLGYSPDYAGSMIEASENENIPEEWFDDIVILTIDTSKLDLNKLDRDPNVLPQEDEYDDEIPPDDTVYSYIYRGNIPFNAIIDFTKYD